MLRSASQHLTKYSPTSTTILYTVSHPPPRSSRSSKALFVLGNVCRVLLCLFVLAVDVAKLHSIFELQRWRSRMTSVQGSVIGRLASSIAKALDWRLVAAGSFLIIYLCLRKGYTGKSARSTTHAFILNPYRGGSLGSSRSRSTNIYFLPNISVNLNH